MTAVVVILGLIGMAAAGYGIGCWVFDRNTKPRLTGYEIPPASDATLDLRRFERGRPDPIRRVPRR